MHSTFSDDAVSDLATEDLLPLTTEEVIAAPEETETPAVLDPGPFAKLGLSEKLVKTLDALGYEEPTPIQARAIPPLIEGRDIVGLAATGTGKTAAFSLPMIHRLAAGKGRAKPSVLVLVPTRELAMQVADAVTKYGTSLGVSVLAVYGGAGFGNQAHGLRRGVDVVVATPGRALDHLRRGTLNLGTVNTVVLDEADEMLDMGFADDIEALLDATPSERQTALFSATMPPRIASISKKHLRDPLEIRVVAPKTEPGEMPKVRQTAYLVPNSHRAAALARILQVESPTSALVFCRTRIDVDDLTRVLGGRGFTPEALHGGMTQDQRDRVMKLFRAGKADLLIATDVAARGLDVEHLSHVVNYQLPDNIDSYVHRIGRVGRAGREGVALTLIDPRERRQLTNIERATRVPIAFAPVPSVGELKSRRSDRLADHVREVMASGKGDAHKKLLEKLTADADIAKVALAALELAMRAEGEDDTVEIPSVEPRPQRPAFNERRPGFDGHRPVGPGPGPMNRRNPPVAPGMIRMYFGIGRESGITPRDLVGAIANEVGISGRDIGHVDIAETFSLVDIPAEAEEDVMDGFRRSRVRGRRVVVRRDRVEGGGGGRGPRW